MRNWKIRKILLFIFIIFIFPLVLISCKEKTPDDPNKDPNNPAYNWVMSYSDDDGETWSTPKTLNGLKNSNYQLMFNSPNVV